MRDDALTGALRAKTPRIVFVNRYFAPDHSATSQILSDVAFHLATLGFEVHVVCGDTLYSEKSVRLPHEEIVHGVQVHRVAGGRFGRTRLAMRAADYIGLYARLRSRLSRLLRPGDVLVAKTDPPLLSIPLASLAQRRSVYFVPWLQDLYPEVATALRVPLLKGGAARVLARLRDRSLRDAASVAAIGQRMADRLVGRGVPQERIRIVPNWADDEEITPVVHVENNLRAQWGLSEKFVVGYSGNLGRAHECDTVLAAAEKLRNHEDLVFLFVGGGHQLTQLQSRVGHLGLQHMFQFRPYQPRAMLASSLSAADVHWLSLRPELEGLIVPSKFYGIAAAGRPVINVASQHGELAMLIETFGCGVTVSPGDGSALAHAIESLKRSESERNLMGMRARQMLVDHYSKRRALDRWADLVTAIVADAPSSKFVEQTRS